MLDPGSVLWRVNVSMSLEPSAGWQWIVKTPSELHVAKSSSVIVDVLADLTHSKSRQLRKPWLVSLIYLSMLPLLRPKILTERS